jgi:RNA 3'-phosphate cyclase
MLTIDGSVGEGGGQILRIAVFCSVLTGKSFRLFRIRHGRYNPGITHQHVKLIELVQQLSDSTSEGASEGSPEISFYPGRVFDGTYKLVCKKPASLTLILQSVLPIAWLAKGQVNLQLQGGTDFSHSMTFDYMKEVLGPLLPGVEFSVGRREFYPGIDGTIHCRVPRDKTELPVNLTRKAIVRSITVRLIVSTGLSNIFDELESGLIALKGLPYEIKYFREECNCSHPGAAITLIAHCDGYQRLGAQGVLKRDYDALTVGLKAGNDLLEEVRSNCSVDRHAADNLIPWLLLWGGTIRPSTLTRHLTTCVFICQQFLPDYVQTLDGMITVKKFVR